MSDPLVYQFNVAGRAIEVGVLVSPKTDDEMMHFVFRASVPNDAQAPVREITLGFHHHGIAKRGMKLSADYWRLWTEMNGSQSVSNAPTPPSGLGLGQTITDTTATWLGVSGRPTAALQAPLGSWAIDLDTGDAYKRVRPHLEKLAQNVAEGLATDIDLQEELAGLPRLT